MSHLQKKCEHKCTNDKNYRKFTHHRYYTSKFRGAAHSICNLKFIRPKEIPVIFHKGLNYDYHFIEKDLSKEFEGEFNCLGENTEKYKSFSIAITKEVKRI